MAFTPEDGSAAQGLSVSVSNSFLNRHGSLPVPSVSYPCSSSLGNLCSLCLRPVLLDAAAAAAAAATVTSLSFRRPCLSVCRKNLDTCFPGPWGLWLGIREWKCGLSCLEYDRVQSAAFSSVVFYSPRALCLD